MDHRLVLDQLGQMIVTNSTALMEGVTMDSPNLSGQRGTNRKWSCCQSEIP